MRKIVIAGNWKMHKTSAEIEAFLTGIEALKISDGVEAIVCSPFPYLPTMVKGLKDSDVKVGAQTMHFEKSGAYTGEVSPLILQDIGVSHVIIGHSERREYFNETDETVNKKVQAAHEHQLTPIVCVGETLAQREADETLSHIEAQVKAALENLKDEQVKETIIAYEPIWAIGTGKTASSEDANEVCAHIRSVVSKVTSEEVADQVTIQYGGSVNPDNIEELLASSDIDGALVGGASLEAASFIKLVEAGNR
ncbi:MAG TPA: triose-phosphate isomerase [Pseudogracilibacillus sp.]|nr:triose-phosphate isomerase [Pseudogracilibacillus sp.]